MHEEDKKRVEQQNLFGTNEGVTGALNRKREPDRGRRVSSQNAVTVSEDENAVGG